MSGIADARLRSDLLEVLDAGVERDLDDDRFNALALRVFAYQFEHNTHYRRYCERRQRQPGQVEHWTDVPPVPTAAFKAVDLISAPAGRPEAVFLTSGTTRGAQARGRHVVPDLELYRRALLPNLRAHMLPDGASLPFLCLVPPASRQPDSSLAFMIDCAARTLAPEAEWFVDPETGLDSDGLIRRLAEAAAGESPVALLGTTLAFVHLLDRIAETGVAFRLARGSRLMDTGGAKGSGRNIDPAELGRGYERHLGIPASHRVNEYGMTELCSQFYDTGLREAAATGASAGTDGGSPSARRGHVRPPWVRTRAVDPSSLEALAEGTVGILQHFDVANVGSVMAVQTEDLGSVRGDRLFLEGRAPGAQPRGCSIAMDLLLSDVRPVR